jgi:hypothetical protein
MTTTKPGSKPSVPTDAEIKRLTYLVQVGDDVAAQLQAQIVDLTIRLEDAQDRVTSALGDAARQAMREAGETKYEDYVRRLNRATDAEIKAAAERMRKRRRELIAKPLERIWGDLARAALTRE